MRTDAPAKWFRLYAEFATDPKVQMLSEVEQRRYLMLLCLRCSNGNVTLHETEVAFQLRISVEEWTTTKAVLVAKGLVDEDGKPTAWEKRQFDSDTSAARVSKHRENKKQRCNVTETKSNALDTETERDKSKPKSKAVGTATASRLPADWHPSPDDLTFCAKERPDLSPLEVADRFLDYWISVPGAKGRKIDWSATWRNWVRNENRGAKNGKNGSSRADRLNNVIAELTGANRHPAPAIEGIAERVD